MERSIIEGAVVCIPGSKCQIGHEVRHLAVQGSLNSVNKHGLEYLWHLFKGLGPVSTEDDLPYLVNHKPFCGQKGDLRMTCQNDARANHQNTRKIDPDHV